MSLPRQAVPAGLLAAALAAGGCASPIVKEVSARERAAPLHVARDERIEVVVEQVLVRNGEGAWIRNAEWDEYRVRIKAHSAGVEVKEVVLMDALGTRIAARSERSELAQGTREMEERYQSSGQLARNGGGAGWVVAGGAIAATGVASAIAVAPVAAYSAATSGAAATAAFTVLPVFIVGGAVMAGYGVRQMVNNSRVNDEIQRRRTPLPAPMPQGDERRLTLFFPLTPLPRGAEVAYSDASGEHRLAMDTRETLSKVHTDAPPTLISRTEPEFPLAALRAGLTDGRVKVRLVISLHGTVEKVAILESQPPGVFDREAVATVAYWRYSPGAFGGERIADETLVFKP